MQILHISNSLPSATFQKPLRRGDDRYAVDSQYTFQNHYVIYDYRQVTCQQYTVQKTLHQAWRLTDFRMTELNIAN